MTITKLDTFTQLSDFDKVGKRIASGIAGYEKLMQSASIAALQHIEKHGNSNVLEPLYRATLAWRNKRMSTAWVTWVVSYSWFIFNPRNLKGQALSKAKEEGFHSLWIKSKGKEMNIDGAKGEPWYEAKPETKEAEPVQMAIKVATIQKQLSKLLKDNMLLDTDGKPVDLAKLRSELRAMIETLEVPHKPKATKPKAKAKVEAKAPKAKPPKAKPLIKQKIVEDTRKLVKDFEQQYNDGLITQDEKYNKVVDAWAKAWAKLGEVDFAITPLDTEMMKAKPPVIVAPTVVAA